MQTLTLNPIEQATVKTAALPTKVVSQSNAFKWHTYLKEQQSHSIALSLFNK